MKQLKHSANPPPQNAKKPYPNICEILVLVFFSLTAGVVVTGISHRQMGNWVTFDIRLQSALPAGFFKKWCYLLMEESPVEDGSLSHYLQVFFLPSRWFSRRISEPSAVCQRWRWAVRNWPSLAIYSFLGRFLLPPRKISIGLQVCVAKHKIR